MKTSESILLTDRLKQSVTVETIPGSVDKGGPNVVLLAAAVIFAALFLTGGHNDSSNL